MFRLTLLAVALLIFDKNGGLATVRYAVQTVAAPIYWLTTLPKRLDSWTDENLVSRERLAGQNRVLSEQALFLEAKMLQMDALIEENTKLRALLGASNRLLDRYMVAQVIGVVPDPVRQVLVIDKGEQDNLNELVPILDQFGVVGQIISSTKHTANVLLLTDKTHAIPVKILRTGVRSVIEGSGDIDRLNLLFVPLTADVSLGDVIVTSGLGGIFPEGYPVGEVETILRDPNQPFLRINVRPFARLNQSDMLIAIPSKVESL